MKWFFIYSVFFFSSLTVGAQHHFFSGGDSNTVYLCQDRRVYATGSNYLGQLGRGLLPGINSPDIISGIGGFGTLNSIKQISGKQSNTCIALTFGGDSVVNWGSNSNGQLGNNLYGDNVTNNNRYPYRVIGVGGVGYLTGIKYVAAGLRTNYAISNNGKVFAWGSGNNGSLGNGTNGPDMTSPIVVLIGPGDTLKNVTTLTAGNDFAIALVSDGTLWAWGRNSDGQLGQNNITDVYYATKVKGKSAIGFLNNIISVTSSGTHVLALSSTDTVWAWGNNASGQLGNNSNGPPSTTPVAVLNSTATGPLKGVTAIAADWRFSVALRTDSTISVWGDNSFGVFGDNTTNSSLVPLKVLDEAGTAPLKNITSISTNSRGLLARRANGDLLVWGDNDFGQLGLGDYIDRKLPVVLTLPCVLFPPPVFVKGTISGPSSVCSSTNSGTISLSGQNGTIVAWQKSTDKFITYSTTPSSSSSFSFTNISQKTYFRAAIQFNGQLMFSDSLAVNIDQSSVGGILNAPAVVCSGTNTGLLTLTMHLGTMLNWESSLDSFATAGVPIVNNLTTFNYTNLVSSTYYRVIVQNGLCSSDTSTIVKITVNTASVGGAVSPSNTVCFGSNSGTMTLSGYTGVITGWEYSSDNFTGFINPISNSSPIQSYLNLTVTTYYRAIVKSGVCPSDTSSTATITVDPLSVGGSIASAAIVCSGANSGLLTLNFHVGSIVDWQVSTDNFSTLLVTPPNQTIFQNYSNLAVTTSYRVKVQSGVCGVVTSSPVVITVTPISDGGTLNGSATICYGANSGTLSLASSVGAVIEWQSSNDNFATTPVSIANTSLTLNYLNQTNSTQYRVIVKNGSCTTDTSTIGLLAIDQLTLTGTLSASDTVCSGSTGTLALGGTIVGSVVKWESSSDNFITVVNPIANTTTTYNYPVITSTTSYRVHVKNGVCPFVISNIATIKVDQQSNAGTVNSNTSACSGANSGTLTLTGEMGNVLQWEFSNDGFSTFTPIANTTNSQSYLNLTTTTEYKVVVQNGVCPPVKSPYAIVTIYPVSVGGTINFPDTVCFGFNSGGLSLIGYTGSINHWEKSTDNFISTPVLITNTTTSESYSNLVSTTQYRAQVKNGACIPQYSAIVEITVNPNSVGGTIAGADTVCISGNNGTLSLSGYLGSVIRWETSTDNFSTVVVPVANTTDTIAYSNLTATTSYRPQIQSPGCPVVYPSPVTVKVDSLTVGGTLTAPAVVCANANSGSIDLVGERGDVQKWETSYDNFNFNINSVLNTTTSEPYINLTATTYYRAVVKNGVCALMNSNITAVTVNTAPYAPSISGSSNFCIEGNSGYFNINPSIVGSVIHWETSNDYFVSDSTIIANTTSSFAYNNLTTPGSIRYLVRYSPCPDVYSSAFNYAINPATKGGLIRSYPDQGSPVVSPIFVPIGESSGNLRLDGSVGGVIQWEYTTDTSSMGSWIVIPVPSTDYVFTNLDTSIYVRVRVKSGNCTEKYSALFRIIVGEIVNTEVKVYPTISPNNDNINDDWIIENINLNPSNQVRIFNRWGDLVYEQSGYDNINNVWRGHANVRLTVTGRDLPEGTYFYVIALGNGKPELSGYVVLNR